MYRGHQDFEDIGEVGIKDFMVNPLPEEEEQKVIVQALQKKVQVMPMKLDIRSNLERIVTKHWRSFCTADSQCQMDAEEIDPARVYPIPKARNLGVVEKAELDEQLQMMEKLKIIRRVTDAKIASVVFPLQKADSKKWRIVTDMRNINQIVRLMK
jgi:hypothetical protein